MITIRNKRTGEVRQIDEKDAVNYRIAQTQAAPAPQTKESLLAMLLPLLGSLGGGAVGALGGPAGIIAGSAIGGGLGETARQGISGKPLQGGKIAGEAALGGLGGGLGVLLKGLGAARAAGKVAGSADDLAKLGVSGADDAGNVLQKTGRAIRGSVAHPVVKATPTFADEAANISKFTTSRYSGSGINQAKQMAVDYKKQLEIVKGLTKGATQPVEGEKLAKVVTSNVAMDFDITAGVGKTNSAFWANKLKGVKTVEDLGNLNAEILGAVKTATGDKKKMLLAIQQQISTKLKGEIPELAEPLSIMSQTYKAAPGIKKAAESKWAIPLTNVKVSTRPFQAGRDIVGRAIEGAGNMAVKSPIAGSQLIGQGISRTAGSMAAPTGVPSEYEGGQTDVSPVNEYSAQDESMPGLKITKEQVALARLTMPDKKADAIEAAYKIMQGGEEDEKDLTEAQVARKQSKSLTAQALQMLQSNPNIRTGMIGGPLEQLKAKFSVADQPSLEFNALISNLTATIAKARAGTSFTPNEEKMLKKYAPAIGDSRQQLLTKLSLLNSAWEK